MIATELPTALQRMIDARLDSVERALMLRGMDRADRRLIVSAIEDQVMEMLNQSVADEPTRDDVLEILTKLDPPEAYLELSDTEIAPQVQKKDASRRAGVRGRSLESESRINPLAVISIVLASVALVLSTFWWIWELYGLFLLGVVTIAASVCSTVSLCQFIAKRNHETGQ